MFGCLGDGGRILGAVFGAGRRELSGLVLRMIEDDEIMDVNDDWQGVGLGLGWM